MAVMFFSLISNSAKNYDYDGGDPGDGGGDDECGGDGDEVDAG